MIERDPKSEFRRRLFSQDERSDELYKTYKQRVDTMLRKEIRALRREQWITHPLWIYIVLICTAFLLIGGYSKDATYKLWFGIVACFWIIIGVAFFIKHLINRNRVELLKEIKEIQLQILELKEKMDSRVSE